MKNLIDELHEDHIKCSNVLDQLADQLKIIHRGKAADYQLLLDAVNYLENFPDYVLVPMEDMIFKESAENHILDGLKNTVRRFRGENHELRSLVHKLHDYIDAAMEGIIIEKDKLERQLEKCIERQREHMDIEEYIIFPHLRKNMTAKQLKNISATFQNQASTLNSDKLSYKFSELYNRITNICDINSKKPH